MKIDMPRGARYIIEQLNKNGYEAYIVGGCVRDSLLNKTPDDWDITTDAKPEAVKQIFKKTIDTGLQHGTVTVLVDYDYAYEVTTYRVDGVYEDHRRPKEVTFTASLEEDLKRRDFTINAMAYNDEKGLVDIFDGRRDLEEGVIRCVGNPTDRFDEDALRVLRAVRFAAKLNFVVEEKTAEAAKKQAKFLKDISAERIQVELTKLITSDHPERLLYAYELGITAIILPEFDEMMKTPQNSPYHRYNVGVHTIEAMKHVEPDMVLRYAVLLHDVGKPATRTTDEHGIDHFYKHPVVGAEMTKKIIRRLKLDNDTLKRVSTLVLHHDFSIGETITNATFRRFVNRIGKEYVRDFFAVKRADILAHSEKGLQAGLDCLNEMDEMFHEVEQKNQCVSLKELALTGNDLIKLGMKPGKDMGDMLKELLEIVLEEPEKNEKSILEEIVKTKL